MAKGYRYELFIRHCYESDRCFTLKEKHFLYQKTDRWEELREARLEMDQRRCRVCDAPAQCVHHRRYPEILGEETVEDLTSLCNRCHRRHHKPHEEHENLPQHPRPSRLP